MATLTLQDDQVLDLVRQLPEDRRTWLFQQLLQDEWPAWTELSAYGAEQVKQVAAQRGLDWDSLGEDERETLIDTLLHENE
jgi:hypothetical protein